MLGWWQTPYRSSQHPLDQLYQAFLLGPAMSVWGPAIAAGRATMEQALGAALFGAHNGYRPVKRDQWPYNWDQPGAKPPPHSWEKPTAASPPPNLKLLSTVEDWRDLGLPFLDVQAFDRLQTHEIAQRLARSPDAREKALRAHRSIALDIAALRGSLTGPADFERFGLPPTATFAEVKALRNKVIRKQHPDVGGSDASAAELNAAFERIQAAHERGLVP